MGARTLYQGCPLLAQQNRAITCARRRGKPRPERNGPHCRYESDDDESSGLCKVLFTWTGRICLGNNVKWARGSVVRRGDGPWQKVRLPARSRPVCGTVFCTHRDLTAHRNSKSRRFPTRPVLLVINVKTPSGEPRLSHCMWVKLIMFLVCVS